MPQAGELSPTGKVVSEVYTGFETESYTGDWQTKTATTPWNNVKEEIESVSFQDEIKPRNTAFWFFCFLNCKFFDVGKLDTSQSVSMFFMFARCLKVQSLDLSSFNTGNVIEMHGMFQDCSLLKSLNVSSFDTKKVKRMSCMFYACTSLLELDISHFDMNNVTVYEKMFIESKNPNEWYRNESFLLFSIKVSNTFKPSPQGFPIPSPDKIPGADGYWYNEKGEKFLPTEIPANTADTYYAVKPELTAYAVYSEDDNSLEFFKRATIPQPGEKSPTGKSVTEVYTGFETDSHYISNWTAEEITCPWNVVKEKIKTVSVRDEIRPISLYGWFFGFRNCTSFDLKKLNTEYVSNMRGMFAYCIALEHLDISSFNTHSVIIMDAMFHDCYKLTSLDLSNFNTSNVQDTYRMFINCVALKILNLSSFDISNVTRGTEMFEHCQNIQQVIVGNKFSFPADGCLPVPSATYISGADGNWYNSKGEAFTPDAIPANTADTYYAALSLVPGQPKLLKAPAVDDKTKSLEKTEDTEQITTDQENTEQPTEYQEDAEQTEEDRDTEEQKEVQAEDESTAEENMPAADATESTEEFISDEMPT